MSGFRGASSVSWGSARGDFQILFSRLFFSVAAFAFDFGFRVVSCQFLRVFCLVFSLVFLSFGVFVRFSAWSFLVFSF